MVITNETTKDPTNQLETHPSQSQPVRPLKSQPIVEPLAPLKYARYPNSLTSLSKCTCSVLTRIYDRHHVLAMGFENGTIAMVNAKTGVQLCHPIHLVSQSNIVSGQIDIKGLSFDASGKYLGAINSAGQSAVFEFAYKPDIFHKQQRNNANDSFSAIKSKEKRKANDVLELAPGTLNVYQSVQKYKYDYNVTPTSMVLDPAYARRRERAVVVGFEDGRLILSKERGMGFIFQKRTDEVLYQGVNNTKAAPADDVSVASTAIGPPSWLVGSNSAAQNNGGEESGSSQMNTLSEQDTENNFNTFSLPNDQTKPGFANKSLQGILTIAWRGCIIAWADEAGIKVLDVQTGQRIAHIDRPSGAREALFPTAGSLKCYLTWEAEYSLLVGWGDCVMNLIVIEEETTDDNTLDIKKKSNVECKMAWELDCSVACGIVPIDSNHIGVLGVSTGNDDEENTDNGSHTDVRRSDSCRVVQGTPEGSLEFVILSRKSGNILSSDALDVKTPPGESNPASSYNLLSSFALSRMELSVEEEVWEEEAQNGNYFPSSQSDVELHRQWDVKSVISQEFLIGVKTAGNTLNKSKLNFNPKMFSVPSPLMVIVSPFDSILTQTHSVDDKISSARLAGNHELALELALRGRTYLRRHSLTLLVNERLTELLEEGNLLSLQKAAKLCPRLLGGSVSRWERWVYTFAKIPGGLFALREFIPVRDPKLPPSIYEMCLEKMFIEIEKIPLSNPVSLQVKDAYLCALRGWGPSGYLKERIKLLRWKTNDRFLELEEIEIDVYRRFNQSAASSVGTDAGRKTIKFALESEQVQPQDLESLFDIKSVAVRLASRLTGSIEEHQSSETIRSLAALESLAELSLCEGEYTEAFRLYLIIGFYFMNGVDDDAISISIAPQREKSIDSSDVPHPYKFVLALIEEHKLHASCLSIESKDVKPVEGRSPEPAYEAAVCLSKAIKGEAFSPIVALIQLVGLELAGTFLVDNLRPPSSNYMAREAPLPLDKVANCLKKRPKLLHWYLHQVFLHCPECYVTFPHTIVPPRGISELHSQHLRLYINFDKGNAKEVSESIIISFLKSAQKHGGAKPSDARRLLEDRRKELMTNRNAETGLFSIELAYAIEKSGVGKDDAVEVLRLYLEEVGSLPLAVQYVESVKENHGEMHEVLMGILVNACSERQVIGDLLEVSAQYGGDVAALVAQIPKGTLINGLIPKLAAAVSNYQLRLKMYQSTSLLYEKDKVDSMRMYLHRSRRGRLIDMSTPSGIRVIRNEKFAVGKDHNKEEIKFQKSKSRSLGCRFTRSRQLRSISLR